MCVSAESLALFRRVRAVPVLPAQDAVDGFAWSPTRAIRAPLLALCPISFTVKVSRSQTLAGFSLWLNILFVIPSDVLFFLKPILQDSKGEFQDSLISETLENN